MLIYFIIGIIYTLLTSKYILKSMDEDKEFNQMSKSDKVFTVIGMVAIWPIRLIITLYTILKEVI